MSQLVYYALKSTPNNEIGACQVIYWTWHTESNPVIIVGIYLVRKVECIVIEDMYVVMYVAEETSFIPAITLSLYMYSRTYKLLVPIPFFRYSFLSLSGFSCYGSMFYAYTTIIVLQSVT